MNEQNDKITSGAPTNGADAPGTAETGEQSGQTLESGTYEVIKKRLNRQAKDLKDKLEQLNAARKEVFGSIENTLLGSERVITRNNCIPRDMAVVGDKFIFGYNVHMGLKTKIEPGDVFAVYEYKDKTFNECNLDLIGDAIFHNDFKELYKYYKDTRLAKLYVLEPYLYMVFQTGPHIKDIKTFKWLLEDHKLTYVDNRSDHEVVYPRQFEFEWKRCRREMHRYGLHPHVSIEDRVFVETVGGDLTIKVEDNTASGMGIYAEDVEDPDQTLDDAEIYYACIGNLILLKMKPYLEKDFRHFVFNEKLQEVKRIDALADSCILLPDNHGLIFSHGYYLQSGQYKTFELQLENMRFQQRIASSNGEDFLYIFYNQYKGIYLLLSYNLISQTVATPIVCNGYSHFDTGEMLLFKTEAEPRKNHVIQIWQTPYVGRDFVPHGVSDSLLYKIGNQEVVRCMAQCRSILNLVYKEDSYINLYVDIAKEASDVLDTYFWLDKPEAFALKAVVAEIHGAAAAAVEEYEKVTRIKTATHQRIAAVKADAQKLFKEVAFAAFDDVHAYVDALAQLRSLRGEIISLKDLRYTDPPAVETMEREVVAKSEDFSAKCVQFLLKPEGLDPYRQQVEQQAARVDQIQKGADGKVLDRDIDQTAADLELLIEIVSNLKIDDPTQTTRIIDHISSIYGALNQAKSRLQNRLKDLRGSEGKAEFMAQVKLIDQAVVNYLGVADSPEKCDEYLTKLMVQVEELEGKFADFDDFVLTLSEKRDELYGAFETQKLAILEKRDKRASALTKAADRIVKGLQNRMERFKTINEINGYFASDLMVEKVRDIVKQLLDMGDTVTADDIQGRLKTAKEDAVRRLKDKQDLFTQGENIITFGKHHFTVNTQNLDLSLVLRDDVQYFHMSGTDFWQPVASSRLEALRDVWSQEVLSENAQVYRAEYLAFNILEDALKPAPRTGSGDGAPTPPAPDAETLARMDLEQLTAFVQQYMGPRYREAYSKGLHDHDGARILHALLNMHGRLDLLIYPPAARALAVLFWERFADNAFKERLGKRLKGLHTLAQYFQKGGAFQEFLPMVEEHIGRFLQQGALFEPGLTSQAAQYLCREIMRGDRFVISAEARDLLDAFTQSLKEKIAEVTFKQSLRAMAEDMEGAFFLIRQWLAAYIDSLSLQDPDQHAQMYAFIPEVIVLILLDNFSLTRVIPVKTALTIDGLHGNHPNIQKGKYRLAYTRFMDKLRHFHTQVVPQFEKYQEARKAVTSEFKQRLRLDEFKSRVLTSFVRNKLIDNVYLPLVGDNLAKQMGVAGEGKRTDLMGLLLLISPPGYGKTTLMEYIANRLGIIFAKINGPAIGHNITSLDPAEAKHAGAAEELKKLNLALEMGNNIMIYLDDIQHCNPEFLQKFISLCDAQRKIEGIYNGSARTYDLRGKKVAVVMAGNPYTESGEKFKIPDMLANRADVYNLGDMLRENEDAFKLSFLENALTSNPLLNKLVTRSKDDVYKLITAAQRGTPEGLDLEGNYPNEEIAEFLAVIKKLLRVRDVVLTINMEYIRSAGQADEYRTEPPFKLQGSYRNMNRIAEKVVPVMNDQELENLIAGSYENDAQTLTTGAEANLLKWKELVGSLSEEEALRWAAIKKVYGQNKLVKSDDKVGQAILQLNRLGDGLTGIQEEISRRMSERSSGERAFGETAHQVQQEFVRQLTEMTRVIGDGFRLSHESFAQIARTTVSAVSVPAPSDAGGPALAEVLAQLKDVIAASASRPVVVERPLYANVSHDGAVSGPPVPGGVHVSPPRVTLDSSMSSDLSVPIPSVPIPSVSPAVPIPHPPPVPHDRMPEPADNLDGEPFDHSQIHIAVDDFKVISEPMARRLLNSGNNLLQRPVQFGNEYRLLSLAVEETGAGGDPLLISLWKCLKLPAPGEVEKLAVTLVKDGKEIWGFGPSFRDPDHVYIQGDVIYGKTRLNGKIFSAAQQLGISVNRYVAGNKWDGIKIGSAHPTDQSGKRLLINLK